MNKSTFNQCRNIRNHRSGGECLKHSQQFGSTFVLPLALALACAAPGAALAPSAARAAPLPSVVELAALEGICAGSSTGLDASATQTGVLLFDTGGSIPAAHDALPDGIRARSVDSSGLVLCRSKVEVPLQTCAFALFSIPRIRLDQDVWLVPVRDPQTTLASARLQGGVPAACSAAGTVTAATRAIYGTEPASAALAGFLDSASVSQDDADNDGFANLDELIAGHDPLAAASPGPQVMVSLNGKSNLELDQGDALTIRLDFRPGQYLNQPADYFLWADTHAGTFAYLHPAGFVRSDGALLSLQAKAVLLDDFPIITLPALGAGDYSVHFEVTVDGGLTLTSRADVIVSESDWHFAEVAAVAGLDHLHGFSARVNDISLDRQFMTGGVAAGDYDRDGWLDLYVTRGSAGPNLLYRNAGNGRFTDVAALAGVALGAPEDSGKVAGDIENSGATFADYDGDGWLDLLVGGINTTTQPILFHNDGDGTFSDATRTAGLPVISQSMGSTFADYDKDGDLDFWMTHWTASQQKKYLWRNNLIGNGTKTFTDVSAAAGIADNLFVDYSVNFADINNDGWPDALVAADFGTSQVYLNERNGRFARATNPVITDENGMGAAVGDYDNDGDLDWFVSSIYDTRGGNQGQSGYSWGASGNRFYNNLGNGSFSDLTDFTATREGGWGWGACFADFNNDGYLDLFHVNGYNSIEGTSTSPFHQDASRLFINDHEGSFMERSVELGIDDRGQGRGIVCFDYDRDGDIDIFVANNEQQPLLYENRGLEAHWLHVRVAGEAANSEAVGARVYVSADGLEQMRELSAGSNYQSQNPVIAYFGLGKAEHVDTLRVVWPSGRERILTGVPANQVLLVE